MKIFIKTPFYHENKYLPHLLEHCVLSHEDEKESLIFGDIDASCASGYTTFETDILSVRNFINIITTSVLNKKKFNLEQKIITEELSNIYFEQKLYEHILKKIYDKNIVTNTIDNISFDELKKYHQQRYQKENIIIINEKGIILQKYGKAKKLIPFQKKGGSFSTQKYSSISYKGEKYHVLFNSLDNIAGVLILDFFGDLIESYLYFLEKKQGKYSQDYLDYSMTDKGFLIMRDDNSPKIDSKKFASFFPIFQKYYVKQIQKGKKRVYIPHIALFTDIHVLVNEHTMIIQEIKLNEILKLKEKFCL